MGIELLTDILIIFSLSVVVLYIWERWIRYRNLRD